jgi:tetratricopeptide (TPR) repeat protein
MKQKLIIICMVLLGLTKVTMAQNDSTKSVGPGGMYVGIYHLANQFNDPTIARMALYHLLMFSNDKSKVLDSMAIYYYDYQQWTSAVLVSKENLKLNSNNELALEIAALSFENMGIKDQSLENYEKLFLKNDNSNTLYKVAFLQYDLKRLKESKASIEILMKRSEIDSLNVIFLKVDQSQQEVSMKAAVTNLKGLIAKEEGNVTKAKELFLEALKLAPGFEIAQVNLRDADK